MFPHVLLFLAIATVLVSAQYYAYPAGAYPAPAYPAGSYYPQPAAPQYFAGPAGYPYAAGGYAPAPSMYPPYSPYYGGYPAASAGYSRPVPAPSPWAGPVDAYQSGPLRNPQSQQSHGSPYRQAFAAGKVQAEHTKEKD